MTVIVTFILCVYDVVCSLIAIRCFGFLEFKDPASLNKVIEAGPHVIDGKQVNFALVYIK